MKKTLIVMAIGFMGLSQIAAAATPFSCRAMGGLGDLFCWGGKSKAENCAMDACYEAGFTKCEVVSTHSNKLDFSPIFSCVATAVVHGTNN
jgi:hypothetical protein